MATMFSAECPCGHHQQNLLFGYTFAGPGVFYVPVLRNNSALIETINIKNKEECSGSVPYTDPLFYKADDYAEFDQCEDMKICLKNNLCPKCKSYTLTFTPWGIVD